MATVDSSIIIKLIFFGSVFCKVKWHKCDNVPDNCKKLFTYPLLWLFGISHWQVSHLATRIPCDNTSKKVDWTQCRILFYPHLTEVWLQGRLWWRGRWVSTSLFWACTSDEIWKLSHFHFILIFVALLIPFWPSFAPELFQCWVMIM